MARPSRAAVYDVPITGRARGGVRVYQPASGKASYRVVWTSEDGRQRERTVTDLTRAHALAREVAEDLALEVPAERPPASSITLGDALAFVLTGTGAEARWAAATRYRYQDAVRRVIRHEDLAAPMSSLVTDPDHGALRTILGRAAALGCTPGGSEFYQVGCMLSAVIREAARAGLVDLPPSGNPMRQLDYRRMSGPGAPARTRESRAVTYIQEQDRPPAEMVEDLVSAADRHLGEWAGTALAVAAYCGARPGELIAMRAAQVLAPGVLDAGGVFIDRQLVEYRKKDGPGGASVAYGPPKWGSVRVAWVAPPVHERMADLARTADRRGGEDALLFPSPTGGQQRRSNFRSRVFAIAAGHAGWPRRTVFNRDRVEHPWVWPVPALRHFYAAWYLKDLGLPLISVSRWLGHQDVQTTASMYTRPELTDLTSATRVYEGQIHD